MILKVFEKRLFLFLEEIRLKYSISLPSELFLNHNTFYTGQQIPLHGDGLHAGRGPGQPHVQLRRPGEVGALLHGGGRPSPRRHS